MRYLITGATGFIGSHLAEAFVQRGRSITALVRPGSDASLLERLGIDIVRGELNEPATIHRALEDVEVVLHCAAKMGNWGPVEEYRKVNVEGLRTLLEASKGLGLSRFIHMSDLAVYPLKDHHGTDESAPLSRTHADGYAQSKMEAEKVALEYYRDFGVPIVLLRPGYVYGPRDQKVIPSIIQGLREGWLSYPGGGDQAHSILFIRNLLDAVLRAIHAENAVGEIYNLTDGEHITKRQFVEAIADSLGLPHPRRHPSLWLTRMRTRWSERWAKWTGKEEAPRLNLAHYRFMALDLDFSIEKAKFDLGYLPRYAFQDAIEETMAWYRTNVEPSEERTM